MRAPRVPQTTSVAQTVQYRKERSMTRPFTGFVGAATRDEVAPGRRSRRRGAHLERGGANTLSPPRPARKEDGLTITNGDSVFPLKSSEH